MNRRLWQRARIDGDPSAHHPVAPAPPAPVTRPNPAATEARMDVRPRARTARTPLRSAFRRQWYRLFAPDSCRCPWRKTA